MMTRKTLYSLVVLIFCLSCSTTQEDPPIEPSNNFNWGNSTIYFLLTDRFNNADESNDIHFDRTEETATLRGFEGGDIKGITQKVKEGYFNELGVDAIWFTPVFEQGHGIVDEGTGKTYGYHGYWIKDWTALDPNFGSWEDLEALVSAAHEKDLRIIMDVVVNHTGPVTEKDPLWENWARTEPQCTYQGFESTVSCTLVENLPDIYTESDEAVDLPSFLTEKWKSEGRLEEEIEELDAFFEETGFPRAPRFYIMKWLLDLIKNFGVDGFRVDTAKHTEETVWQELNSEAQKAFKNWKAENPEKVKDEGEFFMMSEVYGYGISSGLNYNYGDTVINFFEDAFHSQINFEFKYDAVKDYEFIFNKYSSKLNNELKGYTVTNYLASHDDGSPFDRTREKPFETATKLLLSPGSVQIYYGDESARPLDLEANGDASLRGNMNWDMMEDEKIKNVLTHWQKLGQFRQRHPSIGAGTHNRISSSPYYFKRTLGDDQVVIGLDLQEGEKTVNVDDVFKDGESVYDAYSGTSATVNNGSVVLNTPHNIVLLENQMN